MAEKQDRYLAEARDLISSGNKTFGLILIAALIWWIANLFPFNLSERTTRSLTGRLNVLKTFGTAAEATCNKAIDTYAGHRADVLLSRENNQVDPGQLCISRLPRSKSISALAEESRNLSEARKDQHANARQLIVKELREYWEARNTKKGLAAITGELKQPATNECKAAYDTTYKTYFQECDEARKEFINFVDNWTKEGNIDVIGLKINNINVRWHPTALILIFCAGVIWIGLQRRRIFNLIDTYLRMVDPQGEDATNGWLLRMPWWLLPAPRVAYPSGLTLREFVASREEYMRSMATAGVMLTVLLAMFVSGIHAQQLLSLSAEQKLLSPNLRELGDFESASLGLFGSAFLDLLFLTALVAIPTGVLWWVLPLQSADTSGSRTARSGTRRQALWTLGSIAAFSLAVPLAAVPGTFKSISRQRVQSRPYWKAKRRILTVPLSPGWYWNKKPKRTLPVGHFVKPEIVVTRAARLWPPRFSRTLRRPEGRIKGVQRIDTKRLVAIDSGDAIPSAKSLQHLNRRAYSEGIESVALQRWKEGKKDEAIEILQAGLTYADQRKLNIRLYDLLAGLLIRSSRDHELSLLFPVVEKHIARIDRAIKSTPVLEDPKRAELVMQTKDKKRRVRIAARHRLKRREALVRSQKSLQDRLEAWRAETGKWKSLWRPEAPCRWNGLDI